MHPVAAADAGGRGRGQHHRPLHRHRLKHFVLHAARDLQRHQRQIGSNQIAADIIHPAPHVHPAAPVLSAQCLRRVAPDDVKGGRGDGGADRGQQTVNHPLRRRHVGRVIHLTGEDQPRPGAFGQFGRGGAAGRVEELRVDPIAQRAHVALGPVLCQQPRPKQGRLFA